MKVQKCVSESVTIATNAEYLYNNNPLKYIIYIYEPQSEKMCRKNSKMIFFQKSDYGPGNLGIQAICRLPRYSADSQIV